MKRILAIDGGGIKGIVPATLLEELELATGRDIASMFDLIVGTSTGALLATMLTRDIGTGEPAYTAGAVKRLYTAHGQEIFKSNVGSKLKSLFGLADEKYRTDGMRRVAEKYMGGMLLSESLTNTMVTAYDITNRKAAIFKSWRDDHQDLRVVDCILASTAAPTYFEPVNIRAAKEEGCFIDGGVFANNPSLIGLAEAKALWTNEKDFTVISLGCGYLEQQITYSMAKDWGVAGWARPLLSILFDGQVQTADYIAKQLSTLYYRADQGMAFSTEGLDDVSPANLFGLQVDASRYSVEHLNNIIKTLEMSGLQL